MSRVLPRVLLGALSACCVVLPTTSRAQGSAAPRITGEQFNRLRWLEGRWLGSGGGFTAFYEEYRWLNDSTIEQREFPDSTFAQPGGVSVMEWRGGVVLKSRRGTVESHIARVAGDTVRFERAQAGRAGFTWVRVNNDEWRALLEGRNGPIVYVLRRIGR